MVKPRVLVVQHQESCPPGLMGSWLEQAGCELVVVRPYLGEALPDVRDHDALLVLGGQMSANDDATVPWLAPLKQMIRVADGDQVPVLGICLGHQLMAVALGGKVAPSPLGQTIGLQAIGWTSAAAEDLLTAGCSGEERAVHWNDDVVVELPDAAVTLAACPRGDHQVVRFGQRAWGIQAHPEADADIVRPWAESDRERHLAQGVDQEAAIAAIDEARDALGGHWQPMARRFAELAAARGRAR